MTDLYLAADTPRQDSYSPFLLNIGACSHISASGWLKLVLILTANAIVFLHSLFFVHKTIASH